MQSDITSTGIRMVMYLFNKNMRRSIQGLHVDMRGVKMIKTVIQAGYKVVFMPLYKTFLDFFIMLYVNEACLKLDLLLPLHRIYIYMYI